MPTRGQQVDSSLLAVTDLRPDLRSAYDAAGGINVYLWDVQEQMFVFFQVVDTKLLPQSSLYDGNNFTVVHTCPTCEPAAATSSKEYPPCYASSVRTVHVTASLLIDSSRAMAGLAAVGLDVRL